MGKMLAAQASMAKYEEARVKLDLFQDVPGLTQESCLELLTAAKRAFLFYKNEVALSQSEQQHIMKGYAAAQADRSNFFVSEFFT